MTDERGCSSSQRRSRSFVLRRDRPSARKTPTQKSGFREKEAGSFKIQAQPIRGAGNRRLGHPRDNGTRRRGGRRQAPVGQGFRRVRQRQAERARRALPSGVGRGGGSGESERLLFDSRSFITAASTTNQWNSSHKSRRTS